LLDARFATAWYAIDFALGVVAFQERAALAPRLAALGAPAQAAIALAGVLLFSAPLWLGWSQPAADVLVSGFAAEEIAVMGAGAAILVAGAAWLPAWQRALSRPALLFLGRISFSVFLLHLTWIHLLAPRVVAPGARGSGLLLLAGVLALTIASAVPSHRFVELPAIALGNRACRWLARRLGVRAPASRAALP
jgi:peptidoglycan/LPS O-acetylase OafA/YrhL